MTGGTLLEKPPLASLHPATYCVCTATLVDPRTTLFASANSTKMRVVAGAKGIAPLAAPKNANVGVALALTVVVTLALGAAMQAPLEGFV